MTGTPTANYGLIKPGTGDNVDINVLDGNFDVLDTSMAGLATNLAQEVLTRAANDATHFNAPDPHKSYALAKADLLAHTSATNPHGISAVMIGALTQMQGDARYLRSVNNVVPDANGNVNVGNNSAVPFVSGSWYCPITGTLSTLQPAEGIEQAVQFVAGANANVVALAAAVTTVGSTGATIRLALRADNNGMPGPLVVDAGAVDATQLGAAPLTVAAQLVTGSRYWLTATVQGAATTRPIIQSVQGGDSRIIGWGDALSALTSSGAAYVATTAASAALPNTQSGWASATTGPRVALQAQ